MKKWIALLLGAAILSGVCACAVPEDQYNEDSVEFVAYTATDSPANAVFIMPSFQSRNELNNKISEALDASKIPVVDVTEMLKRSVDLTDEYFLESADEIAYWLSVYENRLGAVMIGSPEQFKCSEALWTVAVLRIKRQFPRVPVYVRWSEKVPSEVTDAVDGVICSAVFPEKELPVVLEIGAGNVADLRNDVKRHEVRGIIVTEEINDAGLTELAKKTAEAHSFDPSVSERSLSHVCIFHSNGWYSEDYYEEIAALGCSNGVFASPDAASEYEDDAERAFSLGFEELFIYINYYCTLGEPEYAQAMEKITALVEKYGKKLVFYGEEPFWCNVPEEDFRRVTKDLRERFPENIIVSCMAYGALTDCPPSYFEYCTDLAYDRYCPTTDNARDDDIFALTKLAAYGQKLWLVPWGFVNHDCVADDLCDDLDQCVRFALESDRIVGLMPFTYANGGEYGDWGPGLQSFFDPENELYSEKLLNAYRDLGGILRQK